MIEPGPTIRTARLILRPPARADFDPWAVFMADADTMRFLGGAQSKHGAWRNFLTVAGSWSIQGFGMFSVIEAASARWLGRVGPIYHEGWPGTEVGWGLIPEARGHGYAIEAAAAAMDWAVEHLGWTDVIHTIDAENTASRRVALALGSRILRQASLPPPIEHGEVDVWGQTGAEWRMRRGA